MFVTLYSRDYWCGTVVGSECAALLLLTSVLTHNCWEVLSGALVFYA